MKVRKKLPMAIKTVLLYLTVAAVVSLIVLYSMIPKKDSVEVIAATSASSILNYKESAFAQRHRALKMQDEILHSGKQTCKIPVLDPFESTIMKTMETEPRSNWEVDCGMKKLFSVTANWTLIRHGNNKDSMDCCYREFYPERHPTPSSYSNLFTYRHVDPTLLAAYDVKCTSIVSVKTLVPRHYEFIAVECWNGTLSKSYNTTMGSAGEVIYRDMFAFIPSKKEEIIKGTDSATDERAAAANIPKPSIVILGIDQVSHMQFIRHFPKSYDFLMDKNAVSYFGFNKVGTTTLPNVLAMLTGMSMDEATHSCWNHSFLSFFDSCPFVWKNYSERQFLTSYAEDKLPYSIFYNKLYARRGFRYQPTDYFYNFISMQTTTKVPSRFACINDRLQFAEMLDYVERTAEALERQPYFQFAWGSSLFTKEYSLAQNGDLPLYSTLESLYSKNLMTNTILFIVSDHGYRFSPLIELQQGRFESKLPTFFALFPANFKKHYASAVENFERNAFRLSTPLDFHATLLDLSDSAATLGDTVIQKRSSKMNSTFTKGVSLFLPLPLNRTCRSAGIDDQFCTCRDTRPLKFFEASDVIQGLSEKALKEINYFVSNETKCSMLSRNEGFRLRTQVIIPEGDMRSLDSSLKYFILKEHVPGHGNKGDPNWRNEPLQTNGGSFKEILITLQAVPGMGIFESRLKFEGNKWKVVDVVRLNPYKKQSHCVYLYKLKSFCYCKVQIYLD